MCDSCLASTMGKMQHVKVGPGAEVEGQIRTRAPEACLALCLRTRRFRSAVRGATLLIGRCN